MTTKKRILTNKEKPSFLIKQSEKYLNLNHYSIVLKETFQCLEEVNLLLKIMHGMWLRFRCILAKYPPNSILAYSGESGHPIPE